MSEVARLIGLLFVIAVLVGTGSLTVIGDSLCQAGLLDPSGFDVFWLRWLNGLTC